MFIEKNRSIKFLVYILIIVAFIATTLRVSANSPGPTNRIMVYFGTEYSEEFTFVDLLIPLATNSSEYIAYNEVIGEEYSIDSDSQIVNYSEDGFVSYSFHYKEAVSSMEIEEPREYSSSKAEFPEAKGSLLRDKMEVIKVALLDEKGNIVHVTEEIRIGGMKVYVFWGTIRIDPHTFEVVDNGSSLNFFALIFISILMSIRITFSVSTEVLVAHLFKIPKLHKIALLNIAAQVILTIFMMETSLPYVHAVIIGEIAVYLIEGIALTQMYKTIKNSKLIICNVVANTVTLCLGLLFNMVGIFRY